MSFECITRRKKIKSRLVIHTKDKADSKCLATERQIHRVAVTRLGFGLTDKPSCTASDGEDNASIPWARKLHVSLLNYNFSSLEHCLCQFL